MGGILDELMGGGGADVPPSIPDPEAGAASAAAGGAATAPAAETASRGEIETLKQLLGLADDYKRIPSVTEQERAQMEQVTSVVQKLLASNEQMSDQMSGATPALRKAFAGGAGG
jgi:hypothetical protein